MIEEGHFAASRSVEEISRVDLLGVIPALNVQKRDVSDGRENCTRSRGKHIKIPVGTSASRKSSGSSRKSSGSSEIRNNILLPTRVPRQDLGTENVSDKRFIG